MPPRTTASEPTDTQKTTGPLHAKREQILRGAEAIFLEHGYEGASMSQIAARAKVSKGTLYNHFENKAALFGAMIEEMSRCKLARLFERAEISECGCEEAFTQIAEGFIRAMLRPASTRLYRIIVSEAPHFPDLADTFWRYGFGRTLSTATKCITEWCDRGDLVVDDPTFAAEQFMALCQTRLIHRTRFEMPVDTSDEQIRMVARRIGHAFVKIYGRPGQPTP